MRSCTLTTTPRRTFSPRRAFLSFSPAPVSLPPLYSPPRCAASPPSLCPFPGLAAVVRSGCSTILAAAFRRSSGTPPPVVLSFVKFSLRRARRSGYFVPFCRLLPCLPYSLHAAVSARRHTQRKQAYSRSCAPYLSSSVSTFYTLKKSFAFYKKNLQKACTIQKLLLTLHT